MNRRIWLTGILSIAVIFITVYIYNTFFLPDNDSNSDAEPASAAAVETAEEQGPDKSSFYKSVSPEKSGYYSYETSLLTAVFDLNDGTLHSLFLKEYSEPDGSPTDLVYSDDSGLYPFRLSAGGFDGYELNGPYQVKELEDGIAFYTDYISDSERFKVVLNYHFDDSDYMFRFNLKLNPEPGFSLPQDSAGNVYSLGFGPQLGPGFKETERSYVYRYFCLESEGEKKNLAVPETQGYLELEGTFKWMGVEGRYFAGVLAPVNLEYSAVWVDSPLDGIVKQNSFYVQRSSDGSAVDDTYLVYYGPKDSAVLSGYENFETGGFSTADLNLKLLSGRDSFTDILSGIPHVILNLLFRIIPNYGIGIIILVLAVQAAIFPLSRRTYGNAIRMQLLGPKISELKKQFQWNTEKMNQEVLALFEKNDVKPRSSFLPMIIHLPVFILLYILLLTDIDFRAAVFIPGWIPDISVPEYIWNFSPFTVPVTGWTKLRILPLIILCISIIQSRYIQAPQDSVGSMRVMSYVIPVLMFLVIYNMPSGVQLYWLVMTLTNLILQWRLKIHYGRSQT